MHAPIHESPAPFGTGPLRSWLRPFLLTFAGLTLFLLARQGWMRIPHYAPGHLAAGQAVRLLLLTIPFIVALTLPAAVLLATAYACSRRDAGLRPGPGLLRQFRSMLLVALGLSVASYLLLDQVVPRTNAELRLLLIALASRRPAEPPATAYIKGDREMTTAEMSGVVREAKLRLATATARGDREEMQAALDRAVEYQVEIEKKRAVAAACLVLALAGAGVGMNLTGRRWWAPVAAGSALFGLYYAGLLWGESLGDRQLVAPLLAMWGGNLVLGLAGILLLWRQGTRQA